MEQWENGDDDDTGTLQPTICPDSSLWHGINQTSAIFSFPSAVARNDTGRELRGFADARTLLLVTVGGKKQLSAFLRNNGSSAKLVSNCAFQKLNS